MVDPQILAAAADYLSRIDADWQRLIGEVGPCRLQTRPEREPYEALVRAVAYQQLHARAAEAIIARLLALYPGGRFPSPQELLDTSPEALRACGFSLRKLETVQGIAAGALGGLVPDRATAAGMDDEALIDRLVALRGIGRWTAEMLLIFTLERMDVLPVDDYGVREGWRFLKSLDAMPTPRVLKKAGEQCAPYRSVAAWYLWRVVELPGYVRRR